MDPFSSKWSNEKDAQINLFWDTISDFSPFSPPPEPSRPPTPAEVLSSAFTAYNAGPLSGNSASARSNIHRRVIGFLRRLGLETSPEGGGAAAAGGRRFKQKMRERVRRERLSQCYADLHAELPVGTKASKITVVERVAERLRDLSRSSIVLQRRNEELNGEIAATAVKKKKKKATDMAVVEEVKKLKVQSSDMRRRSPPSGSSKLECME